MNRRFHALAFVLVLTGAARAQEPASVAPAPPADAPATETIVGLRHGEKQTDPDIGQLNVRGLNRSLALPQVLLKKFGRPQFIFAPDPAAMINSAGGARYCYIRPLATIEPTAIFCGMPVNTQFGFQDIAGVETELRQPKYKSALVFVAWEHVLLEKLTRKLVQDLGGDGAQVPKWEHNDFDSLYIVKITTQSGHATGAFQIDHENIAPPSDVMPAPGASPSASPSPSPSP
jgi:hypothetical protein